MLGDHHLDYSIEWDAPPTVCGPTFGQGILGDALSKMERVK